MIRFLLANLLLHTSRASAQDCAEPATSDVMYGGIEKAHAAFTDLDIEAFTAHADGVTAAVPCLDEPVSRHLAAEIHRLTGLKLAVVKNPVRAPQAFAAARAIEPDYRFSRDMIPEGSPVLAGYDAVDVDAGAFDHVLEPADGHLMFDGRGSLKRAVEWPSIVQVFDSSGQIESSAYLWPDEELPAYEPKPAARVVTLPGGESGPSGSATVPLAIATGSVLAAAGGLYVAAASTRATWADPATPDQELDPLRGKINTLTAASGVAAGAGLALGVGFAMSF